MRIILLQDVPKVGKKDDVREVSNGLARNFLIPKGLVEMATVSALKKIETTREKNKQAEEEKNKALLETLSTLKGKRVTIAVRATDEGGLFAKIDALDIAKAIQKEIGTDIPEESLVLDGPIKKIGDYTVAITVGERKQEIKILVIKQET